MEEIVKAKLKEAEMQQMQWRQAILDAQEQLIRWNAVAFVCQEMLDNDKEQKTERIKRTDGG